MDVFLYVADDIQPLADSKTLMVGVFTDRVVTLNIPKDAPVRPSADTPIAMRASMRALKLRIVVPSCTVAG